ncbi:unnamed protein product [Paramecium octaurelia]|uniref:EF-hand domain-containing protein n=1 Tax=Paramecium octaurelia TaxID=43137 RepID=A0A8S1V610_PAROT|nr:unnamed protein product [Paramecium octaurelia]
MDIQQFEKELVTKLQFKASSRVGVETVLLKIFKFFDLTNQGFLKKQDFFKAIAKSGVTITEQEFAEKLWSHYSDGMQLNYKDFINRVVIKDSYQEDYSESRIIASPLESLRAKIQLKGALGLLNLAISLPNQFNCQQLQDYLRRQDIDIEGLHQLFNGEFMSQANLIGLIKGQLLNQFRQALITNVFYSFESRELTPQFLINRYSADKHPDIKFLRRDQNEIKEEFITGLSLYLQIRAIKVLNMQDWLDFYSYFGFNIQNDEIFRNIVVQVWNLDNLNQQQASPSQSVKQKSYQQQLQQSPGSQKQVNQQLNFSPENKSTKSYQQYQQSQIQRTPIQQHQQEPEQQRPSVPRSVKSHQSEKSHQSQQSQLSATSKQVELIVQRIRNRLVSRGARGFISLYRVAKILDADQDGMLNLSEFRRAVRDHKIEVTDPEIDLVFQYFDRDVSGLIDIWGFMFVLRGEMSEQRIQLVESLFEKYRQGDYITISNLRNNFTVRNHPDLKSGKKSDDEIIQDFFEPLQQLHNINGGFGNENISKDELIEYFSNFSASVPDDKYFEQILVTVFRIQAEQQKTHHAGNKQVFEPDHKRSYLQDHHRYVVQGGSVSANAPFGTFTQQEQIQQQRPASGFEQPASFNIFKPLQDNPTKSNVQLANSQLSQQSQQNQQQQFHYQIDQTPKQQKQKIDSFQILKNKILQRGLRGLINIQQRFRVFDKQGVGSLALNDWLNSFKSWRLDLNDQVIQDVFHQQQVNGMIIYDNFVKQLQGTMSLRKFNILQQVFESLPKQNVDIVKSSFNSKEHPDVKLNRRREDDVLCEFIDTFEQHHQIYTGTDYLKNPNVSFEEFINYYNNLSALIEDDTQFEQFLGAVWNLRKRL